MFKRRPVVVIVCTAVVVLLAACGLLMTRTPDNLVEAAESGRPAAIRISPWKRPLVVILADNDGTETTDLLVPFGVFERAGLSDVRIVSTRSGPVELMPALRIVADTTIDAFEAEMPKGADVVIVPAFHSGGTAATSAFLQRQAALGAFIVSICEGAEVVAKAGLFEGRKATTHWYAQSRLARGYPGTLWVRNTRYLVDGPVMSSSGVSASLPISLALVARLHGQPAAERTAAALGVRDWSASHDSAAFYMGASIMLKVSQNVVAFWGHEELGVRLENGFDGIAVALQADAWSRTYRSHMAAINHAGTVTSAEGVTFLTDADAGARVMVTAASGAPFESLNATLGTIAARYDQTTAAFVAMQLEYPWAAK